ncbi:MAG: T9SS type A sorting domain-containing protein [Paludibacteraceae bacterium]
MKKYLFVFLALLGFGVVCTSVFSQTPAFPGAEGSGMYTSGGRGGAVLYVTSLDDSNTEGSLRWAINQNYPRTILFKVSGTIALTSQLRIKSGNLTIAGQSAPGDGITIKNYETFIDADNVVIRFLRFRLGDEAQQEVDAFGGRNRKNVIIDHCSMSWSVDETSSFYDNEDFTMQWCLLAESLRNSVHDKGKHGYGGIWGGKKASFHHNMFFSHDSRNPRFCGSRYSNSPETEIVDFRNNVLYNWGSNNAYGAEGGSYNMINNYYKPGPASSSSSRNRFIQPYGDDGSNAQPAGTYGKFYLSGNVMTTNAAITNNNQAGISMASGFPAGTTVDHLKSETEFSILPVKTHTASEAFDLVLNYAGASLVRDTLDRRYAKEAKNGTISSTGSNGSTNGLIDTQIDAGGWPVLQSGTTVADSNNDGIPDGWLETNYPDKTATAKDEYGYTYLEVYMNSLVKEITDGQGYVAPEIEETTPLFCSETPTELPPALPSELSALITAGSFTYADRSSSNDGCSATNKFAWRTSDVTFTLPSRSVFSANFTSNGSRTVTVIVNGDEVHKSTYNLSSTSCIPVTYDLNNTENATLQILSTGSSGSPSQFSIIDLCILQKVSTSVREVKRQNFSQVEILSGEILADAVSIEVYTINGQKLLESNHSNSLYIANLSSGVYLACVLLKDGSKENIKFIR